MAEKLSPKEIMEAAYSALESKMGKEIKVLETTELTILADYFIICTASSTTHIKTLCDEVEKRVENLGETPRHVEGYRSGGWVLLDLGCVIVHIFLEEQREFYGMERLWSDARAVEPGQVPGQV